MTINPRSRTGRIVGIVVLVAGVCWVARFALHSRQEAQRWRETQKAGGVPRFWENEAATLQTLMNPPHRRDAVTRDDGTAGFKHTEAHGFAEDADVSRARSMRYRYFCLGDSVTYGLLPNSECYPELLEGLLNVTGRVYEVVNAGRGGESTYTALLRYCHVVSSYDGDGCLVGWFAGNEPVEMCREGVYYGPRIKRDGDGWDVMWEDDTVMQRIADDDVRPYLLDLRQFLEKSRRPLNEPRSAKMTYLHEGSTKHGVLSPRYALYGGTAFISAYYFQRYEPDGDAKYWRDVEGFAVRTLATLRAFRKLTGGKVVYVMIPEACEVEPSRVETNPEYVGLLRTLELDPADLRTAAYLRGWVSRMAQAERVPVVDPLNELKRAAVSAPAYRPVDLHPTRAGNRAIAAAVAESGALPRAAP